MERKAHKPCAQYAGCFALCMHRTLGRTFNVSKLSLSVTLAAVVFTVVGFSIGSNRTRTIVKVPTNDRVDCVSRLIATHSEFRAGMTNHPSEDQVKQIYSFCDKGDTK